MLKMRLSFVLLPFLALFLAGAASSQSPTVIPFQAVIEHEGEIIPPSTALTFWIHAEEGGETSLWGPETHIVTPVDGVVSVFLGAGNVVALPVTPVVFADGGDRWLAVKIGEDPDLLWLRLGSVAFAFNADRLEGLGADDFAGSAHVHALDDLSGVAVGGVVDGDKLVYRDGIWTSEGDPLWGYISINAYGCQLDGEAQFCGHLGEHGAIELLDYTSDQAQFDFCFTLPDDYIAGGNVSAKIYWYTEATSGTVELRGNWGSLLRDGEEASSFSFGSCAEVTLDGVASQTHVSSSYFSVPGGLQPGDAICGGMYRSMWDTCDQSVFIGGIRIRYRKSY